MNIRVTRLANGPIIGPDLHPSIGVNIQGPSLIRVPDWIEDRLGAYYLYFADHKGSYIRLAYADHLVGPWRVHPPGSLHLAQSGFLTAPPAVSLTSSRVSRRNIAPAAWRSRTTSCRRSPRRTSLPRMCMSMRNAAGS